MVKRTIAAVGAVLLGLSLASCGQGLDAGQAAGGGVRLASASEIAATEAALVRVDQALNGTFDEQVAGQRLVYLAFQVPIQTCMAAHGYDYSPPPLTLPVKPLTPGVPDMGDAIASTPGPLDIGVNLAATAEWSLAQGYQSINEDPPNPGFTNLSADEQEKYSDQLDACLPDDGTVDNAGRPSSAADQRLEGQFLGLIDRAAGDPGVVKELSGYPACMSAQGFDVTDREGLRALLWTELGAALQEEGLEAPVKNTPAWAAATTREEAGVAADAKCRQRAHAAAMAVISADLAAFETTNRAALATASSHWHDLSERAAEAWAAFEDASG